MIYQIIKKDEYILFSFYGYSLNFILIKYQFKNDLEENNFTSLSRYTGFNYIPIQKTSEDSILVLNIKVFNSENYFSLIDLFKYESYEINSEYKNSIQGPCIFFIDNYKFNYLNSFGIQSNKYYFYYQQKLDY